jgi:predicted O-methyltransferase YrrM
MSEVERVINEIRERVRGPLSAAECDKLAEVAAATSAVQALEVGHYLGLSTAVLLSSLPATCGLVTIDHHQGDQWCPVTSFEEFQSNVAPYIGGRAFAPINADMRTALPELNGTFGFCFYDADHTAEAVADFWELAADLLDESCTLVFDDADWVEQSTLRYLAVLDGFETVTDREFYRGPGDKHDPATYTLEVMRRG